MIKVGFDARRAFNDFTGLGNYSRDFIRIISQNIYLLLNLYGASNLGNSFEFNVNNIKIISPPKGIKDVLWKQYQINSNLKNDNVNIYHGLSNELPFATPTNIKKVVTIHDLLFLKHPSLYEWKYRNYYSLKFKHASKTSNKIIAISNKTKLDIIRNYNINEEKIDVIYQGCNSVFKKEYTAIDKELITKRYSLPDKFILYVGAISERKNILSTLKAIKDLDDVNFVIVSNRFTSYYNEIEHFINSNNLSNRVYFRKVESNTELAIIYQMAQTFIFSSIDEGFGIPILESLYSGLPIITNNSNIFKEAGGEHCNYVDIKSNNDLKKAIIDTWNKKEIPNSDKLSQHLKQFDDEVILNKVSQLYKKLI